MTILFEEYKDETPKTEYFGRVVSDVEHIRYDVKGNFLSVYTSKKIISLSLKLVKRLEIMDDEE